MPAKGIAPENAPGGQCTAAQGAVLANALQTVLTTSGGETALAGQGGAEGLLVDADGAAGAPGGGLEAHGQQGFQAEIAAQDKEGMGEYPIEPHLMLPHARP